MAVLMALHSFKWTIRGKNVQIATDNITTAAYLNHLGGPSQDLSDLATAIWTTANELGVHLTAHFVAGKDNIWADSLSLKQDYYEWRLHPRLFDLLDRTWGPHTMDRTIIM